MKPWRDAVEFSMDQALAHIRSQFPTVGSEGIELLGVGWDNWAYLVDGRYVFRFPRREPAAQLLVQENWVLNRIAGLLPVAAPVPLFIGTPGHGYPYTFAGYEKLPGVTGCTISGPHAARGVNGAPLGKFLKVLHSIPIDEPTRTAAPTDTYGRVDFTKRVPRVRTLLAEHAAELHERGVDIRPFLAIADRALEIPAHEGPTCWVHGDFYPRHIILDEAGIFNGVIDWGDSHLGDPALDMGIAYTFLDSAGREEFFRAYGPIDSATANRARFVALHTAAVLFDFGLDTGDEPILGVALHAFNEIAGK